MKRTVSLLLSLILLLSLACPALGAEPEAAERGENPLTAGAALPEAGEAELMASVTSTVHCRRRLHVAASSSQVAELYFSATTTSKSGHCYKTTVDITVDGYVTLSDGSIRYFFTAGHDSDDEIYTYYMPSYTFVSVTSISHTLTYQSEHPHKRSCECGYSYYDTVSSCLQCCPAKVYFTAAGATGVPSDLTNITSSPWQAPDAVPDLFPKLFRGWASSSGQTSGSYSPGSTYSISAGQTLRLYAAWRDAPAFPEGAETADLSCALSYKGGCAYWSFTPAVGAVYAFETRGTADTFGKLYTADGALLNTNDDGGDDKNFRVSALLEAGETYYVRGNYASAAQSGAQVLRLRRQYTVDFDANGGAGVPEALTKLYGDTVTIPDFTPSAGEAVEALMFSGWAADPAAAEPEYLPGDSYSADADATLYAVWSDPNGSCGESLRWVVSGNTLTISGSGEMDDYTPDAPAPWAPYGEKITRLVIGTEVTGLGDCAFLALTGVTEAALPESLTRVGISAFSGCTGLKSVTGLEHVSAIGDHAFFDCSALTAETLELHCVSLGAYAFSGCAGLRRVTLGAEAETLGANAFERCSSLRAFSLPAGMKELPEHFFDSDSLLSEIALPQGLEKIGSGAFASCASLPELTVPAGVTAIGSGAFLSCVSLREITIPDTVTELGTGLFAYVGDLVTVKCWLDTPIHAYCRENGIAFRLLPWGVLEAPAFTAEPLPDGVSVTLTAARGQIRYTLDGTEPTAESPLYETPLVFRKNGQIKARAYAEGWTESPVSVYDTALERVAAPRGSFPGGSVLAAGTTVSLSCDTPGARILYTLNGDLPTEDDLYAGPFTLTDSAVVYAMAMKEGMIASPLTTLPYTVSAQTEAPAVNTLEATGVTNTQATLHAELGEGSTADVIQFVYFEKNNSGLKYTVTAGPDRSAALSGLTPDTEYWFMAKAENDAGWSSGAILSFRTDASADLRPQSVTLNTAYVALNPGGRSTLVATVLPASAETRQIFWSSSDPGVAAVDRNGVVTALAPGNADITATTVLGRLTARCRVDVLSSSLTGSFDLSELNMATNSSSYDPSGYDHGPGDGGNALMASAYLARWDGAAAESADPYPGSGKPGDVRFRELEEEYHVQNILYLPYRTGPLDNEDIQNALVRWGAVYTALKINYAYFNETQSTYCLPENVKRYNGGHAVVIVGWDDDYPASAFKVPPAGNGAFLCKNSWGTGSGEEGYFWVSYYDKTLGRESCGDYNAVFYDLQSRDNYDKIYQYDELGPVAAVTPGGRSVYAANVFPPQGEVLSGRETLRAVSFYSYAPGTLYEVYVVTEYTDPTSLANLGSPLCTGALDYAGYFTVDLPEPVELRAGTRFAVAVKYTAAAGDAVLFVELPTTMNVGGRVVDHSSNARSNPGESYLSRTGKTWTDYTDLTVNANLCVKAFTDAEEADLASLQEAEAPRTWQSDRVYAPEELLAMGYLLNPAFAGGGALLMEDEEEEDAFFGLTAPSILPDLNTSYSVAEGSSLPRRYDLREEGCLTPVKDQGEIGACWCFAACASLESAALKAAARASTHSADGLSCASPLETSLELEEALSLVVGAERQLQPRLSPVELAPEFLWRSDDPTVAAVSAYGLVTAVGAGTARITAVLAADERVTVQCSVTVTEPKPLRGVYIVENETSMEIGEAQLLSCELYPVAAAPTDLIWTSSDPSVAEVDAYGVLTAKTDGVTEIRVTTADGTQSDAFTLTVGGDGGYALHAAERSLTLEGGVLTGSLTLRVKAPAGESGPCTLLLAFYDGSGRLLKAMSAPGTLAAGSCTVAFSGLSVPAPGSGGVRMKAFLLSGEEIPLAEPLEAAAAD